MSLPQTSVDRVFTTNDLSRFRSELQDAFQAHESRLAETTDLDDISVAIRHRSEDAQDEIVAALARIEDGSFGRCEGCSTAISFVRLEAMPHTRYCKTCAVGPDRGRTWR